MKIFTSKQIKNLDQKTIENEPISSLDLMERAAHNLASWIFSHIEISTYEFWIFCGPGNNGGDGLALARILQKEGGLASVITVETSRSADNKANLDRIELTSLFYFPDLPVQSRPIILIDALFGSGLTRPLDGIYATMCEWINNSSSPTIAIDIPSGLPSDTISIDQPIVSADLTLTLQMPKLSFFFPESDPFVNDFIAIDIALDADAIRETPTPILLVTKSMVRASMAKRAKYSHKGNFGHALLVCGSPNKIGAAILSARAALRSGCGLLSLDVPQSAHNALHAAVPEAMLLQESLHRRISDGSLDVFRSTGAGCGMGTDERARLRLLHLLENVSSSVVLDADALNLLALHPDLWSLVPPHSILTPHPGEFGRLWGSAGSSFAAWEAQKQLAREHQVIIILKGAHTKIVLPNGDTYINSTGNPGMATAGSGDVLTGILTGLLAQGMSPEQASILGVYVHGHAADIASQTMGQRALMAGDIIEYLSKAFIDILPANHLPWSI